MFSSVRDRLFVSIALGILAGDLVTKRIAESSLTLHQPREVIGDVLRWTLTYNTGAAMNMHVGPSSRVIFSVIAVVMIVVILRMWRGLPPTSTWLSASLAMIVAGAAGNLIDRLRSARGVVDFIDVGIGSARFWTFNVADAGVSVGAVILAILTWREPVPETAPVPKDDDAPPPA